MTRGILPETFSTESLDYLQRTGPQFVPAALREPLSLTSAPPKLRHLSRVLAVGRLDKRAASDRRQSPITRWQLTQLISQDLLIGFATYRRPIAFLVHGEPGRVAIYLGTWLPKAPRAPDSLPSGIAESLESVLTGVYPGIKLKTMKLDEGEPHLTKWPVSGFVLGIPTAKPPDDNDGAFAVDRLIRAMAGTSWGALILAQPLKEPNIRDMRGELINELRVVKTASQAAGMPSPLADNYEELLNFALGELTAAHAIGAWRTAVYLMGTDESYMRLAGAWRSVFSGDTSLPEPVRVWPFREAGWLAQNWAMPNEPEDLGPHPDPGRFHHPFRYQTLLNSSQLAAYIHLPQRETSGFSVTLVPDFDTVPKPVLQDRPLTLGKVIRGTDAITVAGERTRATETAYEIGLNSLKRHAFVAGVTGSGKSTTIFSLLKRAYREHVPFLVLEPAKTEYRSLLGDPEIAAAGELQIFTLGDETSSPFRLNPFEVLPGTSVGAHLDLLRSVFTASFGMWDPLPQILEQCLHRIYRERGWDLAADANVRLKQGEDPAFAFPTLTDLIGAIDDVARDLGYGSAEVAQNMRGALRTRVNSLRSGGKGRMLDVQRSIPMETLLARPTILELEAMGDDDDKAFLMGLLLIRLYEHRRSRPSKNLLHLLVIEEAHRLLKNPSGRSREVGDPQGKAVEAFANVLSEIRAYGQGVIVADQVPVKLAPDVIKNTVLKIAHTIVDAEDRKVLGGAMAMTDHQVEALSLLGQGTAAVFTEGDDAPVLVLMDNIKDALPHASTEDVVDAMARSPSVSALDDLFDRHPDCADPSWRPRAKPDQSRQPGMNCEAAREIVESEAFKADLARLVVAVTEDHPALDDRWAEVAAHVLSALRPGLEAFVVLRCALARGAQQFAAHRGAAAGWSYADTQDFAVTLMSLLRTRAEGGRAGPALLAYKEVVHRLHARSWDPLPACRAICTQDPPLCLYRTEVADLVTQDSMLRDNWEVASEPQAHEVVSQPQAHITDERDRMWKVLRGAANRLVGKGAAPEVERRITLCCAQHLMAARSQLPPEERLRDMTNLLSDAELLVE